MRTWGPPRSEVGGIPHTNVAAAAGPHIDTFGPPRNYTGSNIFPRTNAIFLHTNQCGPLARGLKLVLSYRQQAHIWICATPPERVGHPLRKNERPRPLPSGLPKSGRTIDVAKT